MRRDKEGGSPPFFVGKAFWRHLGSVFGPRAQHPAFVAVSSIYVVYRLLRRRRLLRPYIGTAVEGVTICGRPSGPAVSRASNGRRIAGIEEGSATCLPLMASGERAPAPRIMGRIRETFRNRVQGGITEMKKFMDWICIIGPISLGLSYLLKIAITFGRLYVIIFSIILLTFVLWFLIFKAKPSIKMITGLIILITAGILLIIGVVSLFIPSINRKYLSVTFTLSPILLITGFLFLKLFSITCEECGSIFTKIVRDNHQTPDRSYADGAYTMIYRTCKSCGNRQHP